MKKEKCVSGISKFMLENIRKKGGGGGGGMRKVKAKSFLEIVPEKNGINGQRWAAKTAVRVYALGLFLPLPTFIFLFLIFNFNFYCAQPQYLHSTQKYKFLIVFNTNLQKNSFVDIEILKRS